LAEAHYSHLVAVRRCSLVLGSKTLRGGDHEDGQVAVRKCGRTLWFSRCCVKAFSRMR
jgi:hypothetical protein